MRPPGGGDAAPHGIGGEVEDVHVTAAGQHHRIAGVTADLAGDQVADRDPFRLAVHHHQIEHLAAGENPDRAGLDLAGKGGVSAKQELLPSLATGVEGAGNLGAAEGAGIQITGVVTGKGDTLGHALVNDIVRHLAKTPDIRLAGAEIAPLDGVVEETVDAVAVIGIVLGGVYTPLGGDTVGAAGSVLIAEGLHVVAEFPKSCGGGRAGQPGADHEYLVFPLV